jgi:hypothetical protein
MPTMSAFFLVSDVIAVDEILLEGAVQHGRSLRGYFRDPVSAMRPLHNLISAQTGAMVSTSLASTQ